MLKKLKSDYLALSVEKVCAWCGLIRKFCKESLFLTTWVSILINPVFILRHYLLLTIRQVSHLISGRVLDLGCGSKPYEGQFNRATEYIGVEVAISGHNHRDSKVDVFYDGKVLPFPDNWFDSAVSFEVFEHVWDADGTLGEVSRVLKPGGIFLMTTPFAWWEHEKPYDYRRYTSFGIEKLLTSHGFVVIQIAKTTSTWLALASINIAYVSQLASSLNVTLRLLIQLFVVFPLTVSAMMIDFVIPKNKDFYCNLVVVARRS